MVALELIARGAWKHSGVRGPEAFDAVPYLELLAEYGAPHGMVEMGEGRWPSPIRTDDPGWSRPVRTSTDH